MRNKVAIQRAQQRQNAHDAGVKQDGDHRTPLHVVHAVLRQPMERLDEEEHHKLDDKFWREVVAKHRERQTSLHDSVPDALLSMLKAKNSLKPAQYTVYLWNHRKTYLNFRHPQLSEENPPQQRENHIREYGRLEVDHLLKGWRRQKNNKQLKEYSPTFPLFKAFRWASKLQVLIYAPFNFSKC